MDAGAGSCLLGVPAQQLVKARCRLQRLYFCSESNHERAWKWPRLRCHISERVHWHLHIDRTLESLEQRSLRKRRTACEHRTRTAWTCPHSSCHARLNPTALPRCHTLATRLLHSAHHRLAASLAPNHTNVTARTADVTSMCSPCDSNVETHNRRQLARTPARIPALLYVLILSDPAMHTAQWFNLQQGSVWRVPEHRIWYIQLRGNVATFRVLGSARQA